MKYSIQTLNKISKAGTDRFCDAYTISDDAKDPDAILVRSASLHDTSFGDNLKAIARAGAASTTFRWIAALRLASVYSTHRVPMPMP